MLIDPQIIIKRVEQYPNLANFVRGKWVREAAHDPSIAIWHAFFEDDKASSDQVMSNLDEVIGHLLREGVTGTKARAKKLCATTKDNFWSGLTELVLGAKLCKEYPMRYLPENDLRTPDIELTTSSGPVYVEITAMHKTWVFHTISHYIESALDGLPHGYRIGIECHSDAIKLSEASLNALAEQVKTYIVAESYPRGSKNKRVFTSRDGHISVDLSPSNANGGYVLSRTAVGGRSPDAYFGQIMTRLEEKSSQVASYSPCVVVIELANAVGDLAVLGCQDNMWEIYQPLFRLDEIPTEIDLVILTWQSIFGETWGNARELKNPRSRWVQSLDAQRIYQLISEQFHVRQP